MNDKISEEFKNRMEFWHRIQEKTDIHAVDSKLLVMGKLKIISGGQGSARGIYRDKKRTSSITNDNVGLTISMADMRSYPNEVGTDGAEYCYPETKLKNYDLNDIEATKNAKKYGLPIFYLQNSDSNKKLWDIQIGYVKKYNDRNKKFFIKFGENPGESDGTQTTEESDDVLEPVERISGSSRIKRDAEFRFNVTSAYGYKCGVCSIFFDYMLSAAHIIPKKYGGNDNEKNGVVLCHNHHSAFDAFNFSIDPDTYKIIYKPDGPGKDELKIECDSPSFLFDKMPNKKALKLRHEIFLKSSKSKIHSKDI